MERPQHGARRRCSDPNATGCKQVARRNTVPAMCSRCGGGTRAAKKHTLDEETGQPVTTNRGMVTIAPRVQALLDGTLKVEDLDEEELARGYPRAADGSFRGAPVVIPRVIHNRMMRELFDRAGAKLRENLTAAVDNMTAIANNPENDPKVRLDASKWIIERLMGKTPDVTVAMEEKRYERVLDRMNRDAVVIEVVDDGRTP